MDRKTLLALVGAAALGGAVASGLFLAGDLVAAPGDVVPTTPNADTGPVLDELCLYRSGEGVMRWRDKFGKGYTAVVRNGNSIGWNYATGEQTTVSTPSGFTTLRSDLGVTNAKVTTAVTTIRTAGVIVIPGTIQ